MKLSFFAPRPCCLGKGKDPEGERSEHNH